MGFFGIGPMEMVVIAIVALIIFGPGKLPEVAGQAGRAVRDFRRMTSELTGEFEKTIGDAQDIQRSLTKELTGMSSEVANVSNSVKRDLQKTSSSVTSAGTKPRSKPSTTKSSTGSKTSGKSTVSSAKTKTSSTTTSSSSSSTRGSASAKSKDTKGKARETVAPPPVATKADPLADVSFFEDIEPPARTNGRAKSNSTTMTSAAIGNGQRAAAPVSETATTRSTNVATTGNGRSIEEILSPDRQEALARARQRRQAAGYNRG